MNRRAVTAFIVTRLEAGRTIQDFLASKLGISRRSAKSMLDQKVVWINRKCVWMAQHNLSQGDTVEIPRSWHKVDATPAKLKVLVEDDYYIIIDKGSGVVSTGELGVEGLMRKQSGNEELCAVHRLDRDTTGCLLLAKSGEAFEAAVEMFKSRKVVKHYQAVVMGNYSRTSSTLKQELDGERAVTHIRREAGNKDASFIRVRIETGRTHQIRRHLAGLRHPVMGDREYGFKRAHDPRLLSVTRQMLHASGLEMPHPMAIGATLKAHSPLPADFRRCLKQFDMGK